MADSLEAALAQANSASAVQEIVIDNDLRTMSVPSGLTLGVYNDRKTHRLYFRMPKTYSGLDLSDFNIRINYQNAYDEGDRYTVNDSAVDGDDITFSWLVGAFAYATSGTVHFAVCLVKTDSSGRIIQEFNTTIASLEVLEGYEANIDDNSLVQDAVLQAQEAEKNAKASQTAAANSASAANSAKTAAAASAQSAANVVAIPAALNTPEMHANIYRGKNLGNSITAAQLNAINSGNFNDLFIGDYWTMNGVTYRIADFDYWYTKGDTSFEKHHAVVVNDPTWTDGWHGVMNATNTTEGGYVGSEAYKTNLETARTAIKKAFGESHVLSHREYLVNAVTDGAPSAGTWYDSQAELMNEYMVYGAPHFSPMDTGIKIVTHHTIDTHQLALFRLKSSAINQNRTWYWLRDPVSSSHFAAVTHDGASYYAGASYDHGFRLAFPVGGAAS